MMREDTVFGPIFSRRLGSSLGINLLPRNGKLCNFDCIYCECGWNRDGIGDRVLPDADEVAARLEAKLLECRRDGVKIDSITFSGDGEPTLHPDFARIIDSTVELRDRYCPEAKVSVLSNATKVWRREVFEALRKVDNPILKVDGGTDAAVKAVNRPAGDYSLPDIVESLGRFEGNFIMQTMFLKGEAFDSSERDNLEKWMDIVRRLRPREIMVYTIDRETPMEGLEKFSVDEMRELVRPLIEDGFDIQIRG